MRAALARAQPDTARTVDTAGSSMVSPRNWGLNSKSARRMGAGSVSDLYPCGGHESTHDSPERSEASRGRGGEEQRARACATRGRLVPRAAPAHCARTHTVQCLGAVSLDRTGWSMEILSIKIGSRRRRVMLPEEPGKAQQLPRSRLGWAGHGEQKLRHELINTGKNTPYTSAQKGKHSDS